jgi:hypothetical protein
MAKLGPDELQRRLQRALKTAGDTYALEDILEKIDAGLMQAWRQGESIAVTEVMTAPRKKYLNIFLAVGDLAEIEIIRQQIERFAREQGCSFIQATGRGGWVRYAATQGYAAVQTIYRKELN